MNKIIWKYVKQIKSNYNKMLILPICLLLTLSFVVTNGYIDSNQITNEVSEIPTLEVGTKFTDFFSEVDLNIGRAWFYFYVNINEPGIYELSLTMPEKVTYVYTNLLSSISFETSYQHIEIPQSLNSAGFSFHGEAEPTQVRTMNIPNVDFSNGVGLSLEIVFTSSESTDKKYDILISKEPVSSGSSGKSTYINTEQVSYYDYSRGYFKLDPSSINVNDPGFYNLSTSFSIANTTRSGSNTYEYNYDGYIRISSMHQSQYYYASHNFWADRFSKPQGEVDYEIVYLDPNQEYVFEVYTRVDMRSYVQEIEIQYNFHAEPLSFQVLDVDGSVTIPANEEALIKLNVPSEDSIKITSSESEDFTLRMRSRYGTHYQNSFYSIEDSKVDRTRAFSYIQLTSKEISQNLFDLEDFETFGTSAEFSDLILGGVITTYDRTYQDYDYLEVYRYLETNLITIPIIQEDTIFLSIISENPLTLTSATKAVSDFPANGETIDLTVDDPFRIYKVEAFAEDFFTLTTEKDFQLSAPLYSQDDNVIQSMYLYDDIRSMSMMFLPGHLFPIPGLYDDLQNIALQDGTGILMYAPSYSLSNNVHLNTSDVEFGSITIDDIKRDITKAEFTYDLSKTQVPELGSILDTELNTSQPFFIYGFPVKEGDVYNLSIDCLPFTSQVYALFMDKEGDNPFHGINGFTNLVGMTTTLVGKKSTTAYLIVLGVGPLRLSLTKIGTGGKVAKNTRGITPGFELFFLVTTLAILVKYGKNRKAK